MSAQSSGNNLGISSTQNNLCFSITTVAIESGNTPIKEVVRAEEEDCFGANMKTHVEAEEAHNS
jgi:hypothetical protein